MASVYGRNKALAAVCLLLCTMLLAACASTPAPEEPPAPSSGSANQPAPTGPAATVGPERIDTSKYPIFYGEFWNMSDEGPMIPALEEENVPQGIAYWQAKDWIIISNYKDGGSPSTFALVDVKSGQLVKTVNLAQPDGAKYTGHAGGVAISARHVWVSSGGDVYWMTLEALDAAKDGDTVKFSGVVPTVARASFTTFKDGILWVGEYHLLPDYETDASHNLKSPDGSRYSAWAAGYPLDPATDLIPAGGSDPAAPDYILSIPDKVQGMVLTEEAVILSQSYGRSNDSKLVMYQRPDLTSPPHQTVQLGGSEIPVWFLDSKSLYDNLNTLSAPPMSEGIDTDGANRLFVLFESGATKYRKSSSAPMDSVRSLRLDEWSQAKK